MVAEKKFITHEHISESQAKRFPKNKCDIKFVPVNNGKDAMVEDGLNIVLIAFKQYLIYGYFTGECTVEDHKTKELIKVPFNSLYGHVEYVYSRW
jgi:hypothetical protein